MTSDDLVRLRDIGPPDNSSAIGKALFAVSPDGTQVAFQVRQGEPSTNSYCLVMIVMPLGTAAPPVVVDTGGDLIRQTVDIKQWAATASGIPLVITPQWSPDGRWIAFLKRTGGIIQVWRADAAGRGSDQLTHSETDIDGFRVSDDGHTLLFVTRPDLPAARAAIDREGLGGYHFDDRFAPNSSNRPFPEATAAPERSFAMDIATGRPGSVTAARGELDPRPAGVPDDASRFSVGHSLGARAWIAPDAGPAFPTADRIYASNGMSSATRCTDPRCAGAIGGVWWSHDGRRVRFLRFEGWALDRTGIYEWVPGAPRASQIYSTPDLLLSCEPSIEDVICAREQPDRPRHLVRIDLRRHRVTTLFDPNPDFASLQLGRIERLEWASDSGRETFGELVYPVGYHAGTRVPLVVVQYNARGFLRGGTGAEYPVQVFANHGFAVLSVNRPQDRPRDGMKSWDEVDKADLKDFSGRRDILSAIEDEVRNLSRRSIIDPHNVGITGLSDGSSTVQFAAVNSSVFAAGAVSGCCWERSQGAFIGLPFDRLYSEIGWPPLSEEATRFWSHISLARNPSRLRFPLLMQEADDEYLMALESFTGLRQRGAPVDLYVFPGEYHFKWQPAHLLASYQRSLAWFEFWLKGAGLCDMCSAVELQRWAALREESGAWQSTDAR